MPLPVRVGTCGQAHTLKRYVGQRRAVECRGSGGRRARTLNIVHAGSSRVLPHACAGAGTRVEPAVAGDHRYVRPCDGVMGPSHPVPHRSEVVAWRARQDEHARVGDGAPGHEGRGPRHCAVHGAAAAPGGPRADARHHPRGHWSQVRLQDAGQRVHGDGPREDPASRDADEVRQSRTRWHLLEAAPCQA